MRITARWMAMAVLAMLLPLTMAHAVEMPAPRLDFSPTEMALARAAARDPDLAAFYGRNGLQPIFTGPLAEARQQALEMAVAQAATHGLPPARYVLPQAGTDPIAQEVMQARRLTRWMRDLSGGMIAPSRADRQIRRRPARRPVAELLAGFIASPDPAAYLEALAPRDPRYQALQKALAARAGFMALPGTPKAPSGFWKPGTRDDRLLALRARLTALGFTATSVPDPAVYDAALADTVAAFQRAAGLQADGIAGPATIKRLNAGPDWRSRMIMVALERMRWMSGYDLSARHVWVNIPDFTARIYEDGRQVFITRAVVGKTDPEMRTPEFSDEMEYVVVNPRWNVPASITVREYLPRLQENPNALSHLEVVDRRGRVIPRDRVNFAKYTEASFPYRLRQPPSGDNALGIVKFIFPNRWNIYLHDTPSKQYFAKKVRTYSHGCVRVGDPVDLATALLSQQSRNPRAMFQRALNSGRERYLELQPHLPVHIVYFTAFPNDAGQMRYYNDVYGRDGRVWQAIRKAALEPLAEKD